MRSIRITRRRLVKTLLALGAGSVFSSYLPFAPAGGKVWAQLGAEKPTLELFHELSRLVTLKDDLDADTVKKMYKVFMDEPWGPEHITAVSSRIKAALAAGGQRRMLKDPSWKFTEGEKWFAEHLLTTWYLGIYYHEERPTQRITYEHALMFRALEGKLPIPYLEPTGFGKWAEAPE